MTTKSKTFTSGSSSTVDEVDDDTYYFFSDVDTAASKDIVKWIFDKNKQKKKPKNLTIVINSPGGYLHCGFAIVDAMKGSAIPITTVGMGQFCSCGLLMFMTGNHRIMTPNTYVISHEFWSGAFGTAHELLDQVAQWDWLLERIYSHYHVYTGLSVKKIKKHLLPPMQDVHLTAEDCLKYNICDEVRLF